MIKRFNFEYLVLCASVAIAATPALGKNLIFLDNSVSNDTYIPSNKESQIAEAFKLAIKDLSKTYPNCDLKSPSMVERSSLLNVMKQVSTVQKSFKPADSMIVGLIHSSEALLAGTSFVKTDYLLLSSGATSEHLKATNENLFSLANPVSAFTTAIDNFLKIKQIKSIQILVPGNSSYATEFANAVAKAESSRNVAVQVLTIDPARISKSLETDMPKILQSEVVFVPGFIQQSLPILSVLQNNAFKGIVIGTPNWGRSIPDLLTYASHLKLNGTNVYFPISWQENENPRSINFEKRFRAATKLEPMGTTVYTYDAAVLSGAFLCSNHNLNKSEFNKFLNGNLAALKPSLIRDYTGEKDNHIGSSISIVTLSSFNKSGLR